MALILELSPETEARLRTNAAVHGQDVIEYLVTLVENDPTIDLSEFTDRQDFDESVTAIHEGLADLEAGRTFSTEEAFAKLEEYKSAWRREQAAKQGQKTQPAKITQ